MLVFALLACQSTEPKLSEGTTVLTSPSPTPVPSTEPSTTTTPPDPTDTTTEPVDTAPPLGPCSDAHDPNDDASAATTLPFNEPLQTSPDQPDFWQIEVPPGEQVVIRSDPEDIDLWVTDDDGVALRYPRAWLVVGNSSPQPITYTVAAATTLQTCTDYTLTAEWDTLFACATPDQVADTWFDATPLTNNVYPDVWLATDSMHSNDVDWYSVDLEPGHNVSFTIYGTDQGVHAEIFDDPLGQPMVTWEGAYSYDYFTMELNAGVVTTSGTHYLRLAYLGGYAGCPPMQVYTNR